MSEDQNAAPRTTNLNASLRWIQQRWQREDEEMVRRCGTCRWLRVEPDAAGRRVVRKDKIYRCLFEPAWPPLPTAITRSHGFRLPVAITQGMCGHDGEDCPTWEAFNG